jgi:hypothetical protein
MPKITHHAVIEVPPHENLNALSLTVQDIFILISMVLLSGALCFSHLKRKREGMKPTGVDTAKSVQAV